MSELKQVWHFGGGTQSCAIAALILSGRLPRPDFALIADTGRETESTWQYMGGVVQPALDAIGLKIHRIPAIEWGYGGTAYMQGDPATPIIPAFTNEGGQVGKLSTFCNKWWKQDCARRWLSKTQGLTRSKYRTWIGFSLDESRRFVRMMAGKEYKKGLLYLPLVELKMKRQDAINAVLAMGWPQPPRSRCWMCPNQRNEEWRDLKINHPEDFQKAIAFQAELTAADPNAWLHKSCTPIGEIDLSDAGKKELAELTCDTGDCFL